MDFGQRAQAGEPKLESATGLQTPAKKLLVSVTLLNSDTGRLEGKLVAELLGPDDKVVDRIDGRASMPQIEELLERNLTELQLA